MTLYVFLKLLHVLSSTVLFGTGIGIAFFRWSTDRAGDVRAIRVVAERTVLADWLFTAPAVVLQPLSGIGMMVLAGYSMRLGWVMYSTILYAVALACWLPVVWLQLRMRELARKADMAKAALAPAYWRYARLWFLLGVLAFGALMLVFWLMVAKPFI